MDAEDAVRRWHSAKAVLLLLREELQQMRDFVDSLRIRQTLYKPSVDLNNIGEATGIVRRVQYSKDGLENMEEALRLVCDRLDALVTVCDVVFDDCAADLFAADNGEVLECLTRPAVTRVDEVEPKTEDENHAEDCMRLETENRQLFDQIVDMMRQVDDTDIRYSSDDTATHFQTQQTELIQSNEELTDADHTSDVTEANSSLESSYTTCDGSGSASTYVWVQSTFDEISTDFTPKANEAQFYSHSHVADENPEPVKREITESSERHEKISEDVGAFACDEQRYRNALQLLRKEKTLLQLQQRANVKLHHELVQLSDQNRKLQNIVSELRTSLDLKNNEVLALTNKADHVSQLLDEQVEEFRCVLGAVTRESDEELDRLATENSKLKSALSSLNTTDGFSEKESTENKPSVHNTSAHGDTYEAVIREDLSCATLQLLTDDTLSKGRRGGISPQTEDEVSFSQCFDVSCADSSTELDKFIPSQRSSSTLDCRKPDALLVVPGYCIEDLWSEIDYLKNMFERCRYPATDIGEHQHFLPDKDWDDSGAITHSNNDDTVAVDEESGPTRLPLDLDDIFCCDQSLNLCSNPVTPPRGASPAWQTGQDFQRNHEEMKNEGKLTKRPLSQLNVNENEVDVSRASVLSTSVGLIGDKLQTSCLSGNTLTSSLSRSLSDSRLLLKFGASRLHEHCELCSCNFDNSSGTYVYESSISHQCFCDYLQQHYTKHKGSVRGAATQTERQEPHVDDMGEHPEENRLERSARWAFGGNIIEAYDSLQSDLHCFREIMVCDDFEIVHEHKVEEFSTADLQFIMAHFQHHVEEKIILDGENRLLVEEVGRLLSDLLKQGQTNLPVIEEEYNRTIDVESEANQQEVEQHDLCSSASISFQKIEDSLDRKYFKHRLARRAAEENKVSTALQSCEQQAAEQDGKFTLKIVGRNKSASDLEETGFPVHFSPLEVDKQWRSISEVASGDSLQEVLQPRSLLQQRREYFQQELLKTTEENSYLDELRSLQQQHSIQSDTIGRVLRSQHQETESQQQTSKELGFGTNELNDCKSRYKTNDNDLLQVKCFGGDKVRIKTDNFGQALEDAEHLSMDGEPVTNEKNGQLQANIVEVEGCKSFSVDDMIIVDVDRSQQYNTSSLLENEKAVGKCELDVEIQSTLYSSPDAVEIPTQAMSPSKGKQFESGKRTQIQSLQSNEFVDHFLGVPDTRFVRQSYVQTYAAETSSVLRSSDGLFFDDIGPSPFSQTNEPPCISDLVQQMRQQNARLARYLSAVNSLCRQWDYNRTVDQNDYQLDTTIVGLSGSTDLEGHRDCSTTDSSVFLPIESSPFMVLSAICLERPLVVDLTSITPIPTRSSSQKNSRYTIQMIFSLVEIMLDFIISYFIAYQVRQ